MDATAPRGVEWITSIQNTLLKILLIVTRVVRTNMKGPVSLTGYASLSLTKNDPMPGALPIPLSIPAERRALARMFIELTLAFHATIFPLDQTPSEPDANLALVAVAVMLGHAEGRPMTATEIASHIRMPRTSVLRRLDALLARGLIRRIDSKYYLEPGRAKNVPHRDTFDLILSRGFAVLGPYLSKMDR